MNPVMFVWRHVQQISLGTIPLDDVNRVSTLEMHVIQLTRAKLSSPYFI